MTMSSSDGAWQILSSELMLDTPWLRVRRESYRLPDGGLIPEYYLSELRDSAVCVCLVGDRFVIVRQYRPGVGKAVLCHPGGRLEDGDATPAAGAFREVLEETGYRPREVVKLGAYGQVPAICTARVHLFLVRCDKSPERSSPDASERLDVVVLSRAELQEALQDGRMDCLACVAATLSAFHALDRSDRESSRFTSGSGAEPWARP